MTERPSLLDNLADATRHGGGLAYLADDFDERHGLSVATGYVNLGGLRHLAALAEGRDRKTRLLLGAMPTGIGDEVPATLFERTLLALGRERDLSRFPPSRALQRLLAVEEWLNRPDVEVRRYVHKFLHGKAYLFGDARDARAALVTSANLTTAGMWRNLELGLVHYDPPVAKRAVQWFDVLWEESGDFKDRLRELLFPDPGLLDPRTVYLRALLELLGDDLDEDDDARSPSAVKLAPFQDDGFRRALAIVRKRRGVVYADGVGTGKTEIGLAFVEEYAVRRGQHVLLVVPAQLRDHWQDRLHQTRLPAQVVSYQEFAADPQLAGFGLSGIGSGGRRASGGPALANDKDAYRLVVFDEAHALRNPSTTWYGALSRLLGGEPKDLVLLTATPINNGLWDLYHLVMAFARHDRAFESSGIPSLDGLFARAGANQRNAENLNPDMLFELADMVSVRRDRGFIVREYPGAVFPDGTPVSFPEPHLTTERYDLDDASPGLATYVAERIDDLRMARYCPSRYHGARSIEAREVVLVALLRSGVLKRLESCWHACLLTVERTLAAHRAFLAAWDAGWVPGPESLRAAGRELDESALAQWVDGELEESGDREPAADYDPSFRDHVEQDAALLEEIRTRLAALRPEEDPKLALLRRLLEASPSQKVAVFTTFADTVRYLDAHLPQPIAGRGRITVVGAETNPDQRTAMLSRFCPDTVVRPGFRPPGGEVDLLLSNDVLSEGQNLQQAAAVVSYDMPWNPQRMVQRYGRVIRLKSPHADVHLTTMLPEPGDLEVILKLERAIRRKIVAARPFGMEVQVVDDAQDETQSYAARLAEGDETLLDEAEGGLAGVGGAAGTDGARGAEGAGGGRGPGVPSAEALRAELRRELAEGRGDELRALPWGVGAAFRQGPGVPLSGAPGVFFACRVRDKRCWRYVDAGGVLSEPAAILRRIDPGSAPSVDAPEVDLEEAWTRAAASIVEEHNMGAAQARPESVGKIQSWALALLADPSVTLPSGGETAYEALRVGRNQPVRRALGEIKRRTERNEITRNDAALRIAKIVRAFGLRVVEPPRERKTITTDDIGVVCWMAVCGAEISDKPICPGNQVKAS